MTSKIKVDNINKVSDDSNIIKKCGTTTTIGSGASNPIVVDGSAVTLGRCGGTVALASGATQSGFGRSGSVNWSTTPKTSTFTAADGEGYFVNSGSALTMNLPAGSAGAIVAVSDYARNFATYNFSIVPNGSEKIGGVNANLTLNVDGQATTLIYVDATKGWINVQNAEDTATGLQNVVICASVAGSCNTQAVDSNCGDYKIATFKGPGTFTVNSGSGPNAIVDYLVVAGGGGGGRDNGGGGGAGGFRYSNSTGYPVSGAPGSPLVSATGIQLSPGPYSISIGAGSAGGPTSGTADAPGIKGNPSTFSTITSTGGGGGGSDGGAPYATSATTGGSGGGLGQNSTCGTIPTESGTGNNPPVSPPQGQPGGRLNGNPNGGGGGGGAIGVGQQGSGSANGQTGGVGAGLPTSISGGVVGVPSGSYRYFAGGGGGGTGQPGSGSGGAGGTGGGATGGPNTSAGSAGTANTGGGGGGGGQGVPNNAPGSGGSGVVTIRYKFQ